MTRSTRASLSGRGGNRGKTTDQMKEYLKSIAPKSRAVPSKSTTKRKASDPVEPTNGQKKKATTNGRKKKAAEQPAPPPSNVTTTIGNKKSPPELQQKSPPAFEPSPKMSESTTPDKEKPDEMDIDDMLGKPEDTPPDTPPTDMQSDTLPSPLSGAPSDAPSDVPSDMQSTSSKESVSGAVVSTSESKAADGEVTYNFVVKGNDLSSLVPTKIMPTTTPAVSKQKKKVWPDAIRDQQHAASLSEDGTFITCGACKGKGHSNGKVTMRHPFALGAWEDHCKTKKHSVAVANIEAEREREKKEGKRKKQSGVTNYFKSLGKKKKDKDNPMQYIGIPLEEKRSTKSTMIDNSSCAGVFNMMSGKKKKEVNLYAQYVAPTDTQRHRIGSYNGMPSIVSKECTGTGIHIGIDGGKVCDACMILRKERGTSNPGTQLNRWYTSISRCIERRQKDVLTSTDLNDARKFGATNVCYLTPAGIQLREEATAQVEYGSHMKTLGSRLPNKTYKTVGEDSAPGMLALFSDAVKLCEENPEFQSSIIVGLLKAAVARQKFGGNAKLDETTVNFFRFLATHDKRTASVVSANLFGPSERWMRKLNGRDRYDCVLDGEDGKEDKVLARIEEAVERRSKNGGKKVSFSMAIDATKVPSVIEISSSHKAIVGAEYPNHMISIDGKTKDEIDSILEGKDSAYGKLSAASEVKVTVVSFQGSPPGIPQSEIVAARPQSNNDSNDFIKDMERAGCNVARSTETSFTNFTVDGVSCESKHVMVAICDFLSMKSNHLGSTDPNHNAKSERYQIIAGGGTVGCTLGMYVIDTYVLRVAGVSMDDYRPSDFASDHLVLKLISYNTIEKIANADPLLGSTSSGDKGVLAATFFFMRIHLYAVNGKSVPARHRAVYLWCSMLWITSINGASIITKRNMVSETLAFVFLALRSDVSKLRKNSSEPAEHMFGQCRTMNREFTVLEFAQLAEKLTRRLRLMYKSKFRPSRDPSKGYTATFNDFFSYTMDEEPELMEGTVDIDLDGDFVVQQLWPTVKDLISYSCDLMTPFLSMLGVSSHERSPFCRSFDSIVELRDEYIGYCPSTFTYDNVQGTANDEASGADEGPDESGGDGGVILERVKQFVQEFNDNALEGGAIVLDGGDNRNDAGGEVEEADASNTNNDASDSAILMASFQALLKATSADDILSKVLPAAAGIEGKDKVVGAASSARKAKSLVGRWLAKKANSDPSEANDSVLCDSVVIERDVIVLVIVKVGSGASAASVACNFRVLDVYEKYYNKWFMSKPNLPFKKWKKEEKAYKLKVRMLEKNALDEYCDVELCGNETYKREDICKIIDDGMILNVVGKLQQVVV